MRTILQSPAHHRPSILNVTATHSPTRSHFDVLIIGSGNMVHNLRMVAWDKLDVPEYGFDWALQMNNMFKELIGNKTHDKLINYSLLGKEAQLSIPTPEHYLPLIYSLGLKQQGETISLFNDKLLAGSLSMTSLKIA